MNDARTFLIAGAGQAGGWIAKTLRTEGFAGRIILIGEEPYPPYERPPLSKGVLASDADFESIYFWPPDTYEELNISVLLGRRCTAIDRATKSVKLDNGDNLSYDRLAITTGSRVRVLPVTGADLEGVHYLRNIDDMLAIKSAIDKQTRVLVVGGGWIGLEIAATLRKLGCQPVVVEAADRLCARAVTPDISDWLLWFHRKHDVDVKLNTVVDRFEGDGKVERAVLSDGDLIHCGLVVIGIGIVPNTELAEAAGLAVNNGVIVDEFCRTSDPDIFAAGDVTYHPNNLLGHSVRLESWENAQNQGIAAGKSMLDMDEAYNQIPWFWSDQHDANIQMIGLPESWDEVATRGRINEDAFLSIYLRKGIMVGAIAVNNPREIRVAKRLMAAKKTLSARDLRNAETKLQSLLKA